MVSVRVYRALLLAYPREHRQAYGELMVQLFRDRMRHDGGGFNSLIIWVQLLLDLACAAFKEHWEQTPRRQEMNERKNEVGNEEREVAVAAGGRMAGRGVMGGLVGAVVGGLMAGVVAGVGAGLGVELWDGRVGLVVGGPVGVLTGVLTGVLVGRRKVRRALAQG